MKAKVYTNTTKTDNSKKVIIKIIIKKDMTKIYQNEGVIQRKRPKESRWHELSREPGTSLSPLVFLSHNGHILSQSHWNCHLQDKCLTFISV